MENKLKGVVFDMDGVIIESEFTHYTAICEAMGEKMDQTYQTFLSKCTGGDERFAMGRLAELSGIAYDEDLFLQWSEQKAKSYRRLVGETAKPMPGAVDLVLSAAEEFAIALATGSRRSDVDAAFEVLETGKLKGIFSAIVTSDDVAKPKPDPATYAKAVAALGVPATHCLAIEDSPNGIASAKGAGLRVLGIATIHGIESLSQADWVRNSLADLQIEDLLEMFERN
ncbi:MAG: HAD family phosphatase [Opitutae bacterium]